LILLISLVVFSATVAGSIGLYWWLETRRESLPSRLKEVVEEGAGAPREGIAEIAEKWIDSLRKRFSVKPSAETDLVDRLSGKWLTGTRFLLSQAGYRSVVAYRTYLGLRWGMPLAFVTLAVAYGLNAGLPSRSMILMLPVAVISGLILPDILLRWGVRRRQEEITDALPDGLDLLVVCIEAGLGINAAFLKITEEFVLTSPALSEEFDIVNREMVAGKPRQEALRALSERTGVEEVKSLVAMLIQTEKLGTSLSQSLRVHSDSLRTRRRQRAEEAAAKTTIKLVFPLVFLLFPALYIVLLGPGVIKIMKVLLPVVAK
jgi:tight adherence protein C